jgi:beta-glucuronidase
MKNEEGEAQGWDRTLPPGTEVVRLPHTWNPGKIRRLRGRRVVVPSLAFSPAIRGQQVELHFAAAFYESHVRLNGKLLATEVTQ